MFKLARVLFAFTTVLTFNQSARAADCLDISSYQMSFSAFSNVTKDLDNTFQWIQPYIATVRGYSANPHRLSQTISAGAKLIGATDDDFDVVRASDSLRLDPVAPNKCQITDEYRFILPMYANDWSPTDRIQTLQKALAILQKPGFAEYRGDKALMLGLLQAGVQNLVQPSKLDFNSVDYESTEQSGSTTKITHIVITRQDNKKIVVSLSVQEITQE